MIVERKSFLIFLVCLLACQLSVKKLLAQDSTTSGTVLYADPRLAVLVKKNKDVKLGVIRSGRGFRVQIYSGTDRNKANQLRMDFMRRFPGTRTYLTYAAPQYRVKVGDFADRKDAQALYNSVRSLYNPCMIVPDLVEINTLKDD